MGDEERRDEEQRDGASEKQGGAAKPEPRPAEAFKQGMSLLWKAARSAADEIKREVEKGGVSEALHQAGRDLEAAANEASKAIESFLGRIQPPDPQTSEWPGAPKQPPQAEERAGEDEDDAPKEVRIQVDE